KGGSGRVARMSTATNPPGTPIPGGRLPYGIAITPDGKTAYVANGGSNTVTPISTATNPAGKPIPVGPGPTSIAITPDGKTAYVADWGRGIANIRASDSVFVTPISTATNRPGKPIRVGHGPPAIAITPHGKTASGTNAHAG